MALDPTTAAMAALAAELDGATELHGTLDAMTRAALTLVPGCAAASVTIRRNRTVETLAPTGEMASTADRLQYESNEGPCLDTAQGQLLTISGDITQDARWPRWGPAAHRQAGVTSILAVQLSSRGEAQGALNLFSPEPEAFDAGAVALASVLSVHAGVALRASRLADDLSAAISSRRLIGQAQGLLMERYKLDADSAFALLKRWSQTSNIKLRVLAERVVQNGPATSEAVRPPALPDR